MSDSVTRSAFIESFRSTAAGQGPAGIALEELSQAQWEALVETGLDREGLAAVAGPDRRIAGDREVTALFALVDQLDADGSRFSIARHQRSAGAAGLPAPTAAGVAHDRLLAARGAALARQRDDFVATFSAGEIDLGRLAPAAAARLAELGAPLPALRTLAAADGRIRGPAALRSLFALVDRLDRDGSAASYARSRPVPLGATPRPDQLTAAGEVEAILERVFVPYAQPYTEYLDGERAQRVPAPPPAAVALPVEPLAQWDSTSCYQACRRMLAGVDAAAAAQVNDGRQSHYAARAENGRGELTGAGRDFARLLAYVDGCLERGRPVIVGLSHADRDYNYDRITDHFVVVRGRGVDDGGRLYYEFADPATRGENRVSRFYVDRDSAMLFRPATHQPPRRVAEKPYQVASVVTYRDAGFSFDHLIGSPATGYR